MQNRSKMVGPVAKALAEALTHGTELPSMFGRDEDGIHLRFDEIEMKLIPTGGAEVRMKYRGDIVWRQELEQVLQAEGDVISLCDLLGGRVRINLHSG